MDILEYFFIGIHHTCELLSSSGGLRQEDPLSSLSPCILVMEASNQSIQKARERQFHSGLLEQSQKANLA